MRTGGTFAQVCYRLPMTEVQPLVGNALHHPKLGRGVIVDTNDKIVTIRFMRGRERRILRDRLVANKPTSHVPEAAEAAGDQWAPTLASLAGDAAFEVPAEDGSVELSPFATTLPLPSGALMLVDPRDVLALESAAGWADVFNADNATHRLLKGGTLLVTRWHDPSGQLAALTLSVDSAPADSWLQAPEPELSTLDSVAWLIGDSQTLLEVDKATGLKRGWKRASKPKGPFCFGLTVGRKRVKQCDDEDPPELICAKLAGEPGDVCDAYGVTEDGQLSKVILYSKSYFTSNA